MSGTDPSWPKIIFEICVAEWKDPPSSTRAMGHWRTAGQGWVSTGDHDAFVGKDRLTQEQLEELAVAVDKELKKRGK